MPTNGRHNFVKPSTKRRKRRLNADQVPTAGRRNADQVAPHLLGERPLRLARPHMLAIVLSAFVLVAKAGCIPTHPPLRCAPRRDVGFAPWAGVCSMQTWTPLRTPVAPPRFAQPRSMLNSPGFSASRAGLAFLSSCACVHSRRQRSDSPPSFADECLFASDVWYLFHSYVFFTNLFHLRS